jgi:hypothetical protein
VSTNRPGIPGTTWSRLESTEKSVAFSSTLTHCCFLKSAKFTQAKASLFYEPEKEVDKH